MSAFASKKVYITGGSSGIGLCAAVLFAQAGAHVCLFARNRERLDKALEKVRTQGAAGKKFSAFCLDVVDPAQVEPVMAEAVNQFGRPDILINCAGRARPMPFASITFAQFDETMKINLYGARNTIAALLPFMKEGGCIVNVSSVAGLVGVFGYTDYCASKFALVGFSEALRSELACKGIRVSVLCPPDTDTPGLEEENLTKPEETKAISASAKLMRPEDVAAALLNGIAKGKFLIIPGFDGKMTWFAKRMFPSLVEWIMQRAVCKVQQGG